jgi:hypothetical protein
LAAGLCTSFILADGVTKTVGSWLLSQGLSEMWMPSVAGGLFLLPLAACVWVLSKTPAPDDADVSARCERMAMTRADRLGLFRRHALPLSLLALMYLWVTILRSFRADFMPELWSALGVTTVPSTFTWSELWIALGVMSVSACAVLVHDNRRAFFLSLVISAFGFVLVAISIIGRNLAQPISPFAFMVTVGLGLYLPYVAVHTTVFERLLAMTREKGNVGFLMYVVDSIGYLGYVAVMLANTTLDYTHTSTAPIAAQRQDYSAYLTMFITLCAIACLISWAVLALCWRHYAVRHSSL